MEHILCPLCGHDYTHHSDVVILDRGEDSDGILVTTAAGVSTVETVASLEAEEDFGTRRNQVRIRVTCEACEKESWIVINQHKGCTYFYWLHNESRVEVKPW